MLSICVTKFTKEVLSKSPLTMFRSCAASLLQKPQREKIIPPNTAHTLFGELVIIDGCPKQRCLKVFTEIKFTRRNKIFQLRLLILQYIHQFLFAIYFLITT